jgi:hypothetical protein
MIFTRITMKLMDDRNISEQIKSLKLKSRSDLLRFISGNNYPYDLDRIQISNEFQKINPIFMHLINQNNEIILTRGEFPNEWLN